MHVCVSLSILLVGKKVCEHACGLIRAVKVATMDDLSLLARLPDNVKRSILLSLTSSDQQVATASSTANGQSQKQIYAAKPNPEQVQQTVPGGQTASLQSGQKHGSAAPSPDIPPPQQLLLPPLQAGLAVVDNVLSQQHIQDSLSCAEAALAEKHREAGMGGSLLPWKDTQARGDLSRWLHIDEELAAGRTSLVHVLALLQQLQAQLQHMGYDVGGRATYQLACYPGEGRRYVRHADRSDSAPSRRLTAIIYLNAHWTPQAGGQLAVYNCSGRCAAVGWEAGEPAVLVAPAGGRLVVFESHLDHEVLPAHAPRWAVTAWFHCAKPDQAVPAPGVLQGIPGAPRSNQGTSLPSAAGPSLAAQAASSPAAQAASSPAAQAVSPPAAQAVSPPAASTGAQTPTAAVQVASSDDKVQDQIGSSVAQITSQQVDEHTAAGGSGDVTDKISERRLVTLPAGLLPDQPRMFVSIAAYRDSECQWTIRDVFLRARYPHRVHVGVVWQVDYQEDAGFMKLIGSAEKWAAQVREVRVPASEATGPCKARALAAALWAGEEYLLQVDAHMRFVQDWDELCIQQLHRAEALVTATNHQHPHPPVSSSAPASVSNTSGAVSQSQPRVVLTTYPPGYEGEGMAVSYSASLPPTVLCLAGLDQQGMMRTKARILVHDWESVLLRQATQHTRVPTAETQSPPAALTHSLPVALTAAQQPSQQQQLSETAAQQPSPEQQQQLSGAAAQCVSQVLSHRQPGDPLPCVGWAAGFSFSRAAALKRHAPYPPPSELPHLFFGEEVYMFARLWTRGYEFFSPSQTVCYHQWHRSARKYTISKAVVDNPERQQQRDAQRAASQRKVMAVLTTPSPDGSGGHGTGVDSTNAEATDVGASTDDESGCVTGAPALPIDWQPGGCWGLGTHRTVQELQDRCGVCFSEQRVTDTAACCAWLPSSVFEP